eukprot:scaffold1573_cov125-Isochrysis_galbana.AAC.6
MRTAHAKRARRSPGPEVYVPQVPLVGREERLAVQCGRLACLSSRDSEPKRAVIQDRGVAHSNSAVRLPELLGSL